MDGRGKGHCGGRCPETHFEDKTPKIKPPLWNATHEGKEGEEDPG